MREEAEVENLHEPGGSGRAIMETVKRSLPKAAVVWHHPALHFADVAVALSKGMQEHPCIGRGGQKAKRFAVPAAPAGGDAAGDLGGVRFWSTVWTVHEWRWLSDARRWVRCSLR